jgi:hypothetical protein
MTRLIATLLFLPVATCAYAFDFSSYNSTTIDSLRSTWDATTKDYSPGLSILPFQKLKIKAAVVQSPEPCKSKQLEKVFTVLGQKDFLKVAPVNNCIRLRENETGYNYFAYIQDALLPAFIKEVVPSEEVELYVLFPAYTVRQDKSQNMPMLLVTEFQRP